MPAQIPVTPIQRPLMPIQRPTLQAAAAVAMEASVLGTLYSLAQSFNIQFLHLGSLQCWLVSLSGLSGSPIVWVISPWDLDWDSSWQMGQEVAAAAPIGPPPVWQCPHLHKWLLREDRMSWMASSLHWAPRAVGQAIFLVNILHGKGPGSPSERSSTPQVVWQVFLPWGPALAGPATGLSR